MISSKRAEQKHQETAIQLRELIWGKIPEQSIKPFVHTWTTFYQEEIVYCLLTVMGLSLDKLLSFFLDKPSVSLNWVHLRQLEKFKM